ncbi:bestrophin-like domain [Tropicimonas aquimaris]
MILEGRDEMNGTETADLYVGFIAPLLPFSFLAVLTLVALPAAAFLGFHIGRVTLSRRQVDGVLPEQAPGATSLGAMLALLGLLLGFAFSSALGWREARQIALVNEAAAISTAFLTANLVEDPGRSDLQSQLLAYANTRIASRADIGSMEAWNAFLERTLEAQAKVWPATMQAIGGTTSDPIRAAVVRSVTDMLDAHTYRVAAAAEQIPPPAKLMIFLASVVAIFVVGNRTAMQGKTLTWHVFAFAGLLSVVMIVIFDLDRALEGTMRVNPDTMNQTIREMEAALAASDD